MYEWCGLNARSPRTELQEAREHVIRESYIRMMEARLVREELGKCWRTEVCLRFFSIYGVAVSPTRKQQGVNHYHSCRELTQKYLEMVRTHR
jgi:hypothetical protein